MSSIFHQYIIIIIINLQEETLNYIKKKIEGVISEMREKKGTTILIFLPALNDKNMSSDDSNNNVFQKQKHQ